MDLLRPQPIMHSMLSFGNDEGPASMTAIAARIFSSALPLRVTLPKRCVLSSSSSSPVEVEELKSLLLLAIRVLRVQRPTQKKR